MARRGLLRLMVRFFGPQEVFEVFAQKPLNCSKLSIADRKVGQKVAKNDCQVRSVTGLFRWQSVGVAWFDHASSLAASVCADFPGRVSKTEAVMGRITCIINVHPAGHGLS